MLSTEVIPEHLNSANVTPPLPWRTRRSSRLTSAMRETACATRESISAFRAASPTKGFLCTTNTATNGTTCAAADRYCTISQITCSRKDVEYSLISESLDDHSVSAWNDYTLAYKYFLTQHIKLPKDRIFRKIGDSSPQIEYQEFLRQRLKGFESLTVYHALIQELMAKTQFPGNDNERRLLRGIRCTTTTALRRAQYDKPVWFERAVYESGSLFVARPLGKHKTLQAVPHSRVLGVYFLERGPGYGATCFYNDLENEAIFVAPGLPAHKAETIPQPTQDSQGLGLTAPEGHQ